MISASVTDVSEYKEAFTADMATMVADQVFSIAREGKELLTIAEEICIALQSLIKHLYI